MPVRFTSSTPRQTSSGSSSIGTSGCDRPALLNSRSTRPNVSRACSNSATTDASSLTSVGTGRSGPPMPCPCRAVCSSAAAPLPASTTDQPSPARASAAARPMPLPAPVTIATRARVSDTVSSLVASDASRCRVTLSDDDGTGDASAAATTCSRPPVMLLAGWHDHLMANVQHDYRYGPGGPERVYRKTRPAEHPALAREVQTRMLEMIDAHFIEAVSALTPGSARDHRLPVREGSSLTGARCLELFDAQLASRHLDLAARWLRGQGKGFYTIASAGHEGNAAVAAALRRTDPALLHYRSGAFYLERAWQVPGQQPLRDVLLGVVAAAEEPIAGGRHKVFGHPDLAVIPQTSTIASHLPRAVGTAFAIERAKRLGVSCAWPADAVVVCNFGDASVNHSTATGAINAACHGACQRLPLPLLLVCEDNGLGISVRTPEGWVRSAHGNRPGLRYLTADGCDLAEAYDAALQAVAWVRERRAPAFLHLRVVRFGGHAGSDAEVAYRTPGEIAADADRDPLVGTARLLVHGGVATPQELVGRYEATRLKVLAIAEDVAGLPQLPTAEAVLAPLAPNLTLADLLALHPELLVFGEDVGRKGGVYGVTRGLQRRFGAARVFDTLLDEQTILGLALGAGLSDLLPIPEIQYLAYLHNAEDQIRGEAATLQFFSRPPTAQPDGRARPGLRLPEGVRWPLPQRQRDRGAARRARGGHRVPGQAGRCRRHAAHLRGGGEGRRQRLRLPRADRALPHPRPARRGRPRLARAVSGAERLERGARAAGPRAGLRGRARPHAGDVRQWPVHEPSGGEAAVEPGHRLPCSRPAMARPAAGP